MKKYSYLLFIVVIACGPSEEDIQARIDEAVSEATSTTTLQETTTTRLVTTTTTL